MIRRSTAALVVTIVALATVVTTSAVASATSYRYWTYWTGGSSWTFANAGASRVPADGSVEGWRFEISGTSASKTPRYTPGFARICDTTPARAGKKRVAVVIDYGTAADAPPGESAPGGVLVHCARVDTSFNGYQILESLTSIRVEQGMVCGVNGYPASGCAEPVVVPSPTPTHKTSSATPQASPTASQGGAQAHSSPSPSVSPTTSRSAHHSTHSARAHPGPAVSTVAADATVAAAASTPSSPTGGTVSGPWALVVFAVIVLVTGGAAWLARQRRQAQR